MSSSTQDIESVTLQTVDHFVEEGFLFTALDISNVVKKSLPGVRHREVAAIVRELFDDGKMGDEYSRSVIDVEAQGKQVQALLYHHEDDDADEYAGTQRQQTAKIPVPASSIAAAVQAGVPSQCELDIGKDGRARLPLAFLRAAQLSGSEFELREEPGGSSYSLSAPGQAPQQSTPPLATLTVQHPQHLHIALSYFTALDLSQGLKARLDQGRVLIEAG